jgi:DNA-binding protein YbaB
MTDDIDIQKAVERMQNVLEHVQNGDKLHTVEIDLQHACAALGVSPKHIYPDDVDGLEYWNDESNWLNEDTID